jgi:DNA-binding NarL/FixJ family response regulator
MLVEDHPVFREGLRHAIERDPAFEVVGEAADGEAALAMAERLKPALAVVDVGLPGMDGLTLARRLHGPRHAVKVTILTMHNEETILNAALNAGALGYVLKDNLANEILTCLKAVALGDHYVTPAMSGFLVRRWNRTNQLAASVPSLDSLTTAELRVLKLVAQNKSSREVGQELFISHRTVEAHRASICSKLGLRGAHRLLHFAFQHAAEL